MNTSDQEKILKTLAKDIKWCEKYLKSDTDFLKQFCDTLLSDLEKEEQIFEIGKEKNLN